MRRGFGVRTTRGLHETHDQALRDRRGGRRRGGGSGLWLEQQLELDGDHTGRELELHAEWRRELLQRERRRRDEHRRWRRLRVLTRRGALAIALAASALAFTGCGGGGDDPA